MDSCVGCMLDVVVRGGLGHFYCVWRSCHFHEGRSVAAISYLLLLFVSWHKSSFPSFSQSLALAVLKGESMVLLDGIGRQSHRQFPSIMLSRSVVLIGIGVRRCTTKPIGDRLKRGFCSAMEEGRRSRRRCSSTRSRNRLCYRSVQDAERHCRLFDLAVELYCCVLYG